MDKISELAQVSKRTVYNHFETKEALVMHIMSEMWRKSTIQPDFKYIPNTPLHDQLSSILLAEAKMFSSKENLELSRVAFGHFFTTLKRYKKRWVSFQQEKPPCFNG
ncbi:TetR/AcrR family transcriptional regulator [Vibrio algarum]|uniref:TetR/AcrR family transcriptional regulator n=1 Tax=Vibrio algarum TaxID=3020714 RepID=A0ABT4YPW8_9VIBR|nr:TetR/AcrR family transcriptional regulator [Vibrio sp. KJ40-1]MDB1123520.1 TetR/AcrR family transcriptional regulator [Vibrio sp. KJ40-1]